LVGILAAITSSGVRQRESAPFPEGGAHRVPGGATVASSAPRPTQTAATITWESARLEITPSAIITRDAGEMPAPVPRSRVRPFDRFAGADLVSRNRVSGFTGMRAAARVTKGTCAPAGVWSKPTTPAGLPFAVAGRNGVDVSVPSSPTKLRRSEGPRSFRLGPRDTSQSWAMVFGRVSVDTPLCVESASGQW
jgi:hypothetical protein